MHVHMRHFLEGSGTHRVPQAHALVRESPVNRSGDPYQRVHQPGARSWIKVPYVANVPPRDDQYMSGIVLAWINKSDSQIILIDDVSRRATRQNLAEDALGAHHYELLSLPDPFSGAPSTYLRSALATVASAPTGR
jgi:hypothetical protein